MKILKITSLSNPAVKDAMRLAEKPSKDGSFIIEGPHLLEAALSSGCAVKEIFFTEAFGSKNEGRRLIRLAQEKNIRLIETDDAVIAKISDAVTSQGTAAVVTLKPAGLQDINLSGNPLVAVCEGVQDPGNTGTIIRTADAVAADAVVLLEGCCNPFNPKSVRSTAGSIFNIPVVMTTTSALLDYLKEHKIPLYASSVAKGIEIFEADLREPVAIAFGSEAHGLGSEITAGAAAALTIPIKGRAESLNVASAAAVCLYEALRQRKTA
ncbi:MAG: RNA methyltransferase [Nitrospiraceae bacterium]|nr:RNA methyltransferase [Nitrospiraceae bacterium]